MTTLDREHGFLEVEPDDPRDQRRDREVVLLLHGLGGNKDDWRFPAWREVHWDHAHDPPNRHNDNKFGPPLSPLELLPEFGLSELRTDTDLRCWSGVLKALGHTIINYNQDGNQDSVDVPLTQFEQRIVPFIRENVLTGELAGKRVVLLCHSRGGILARAYLRKHPEGREWISQLITLCTPHQGTRVARAKQKLADAALALASLGVLGPGLLAATIVTQIFVDLDQSEAANQLLPGNPVFDQLASPDELRNMNIEVRTFGGTSVRYGRVYTWLYTPDSYLPNFSDVPDFRFDWTQFPVEVPLASPMLDELPDAITDDEQDDGEGDGLVADAQARLRGFPHESFPVNHAEALWDEDLFARVADLLGTPLSDAGPVECGHRATSLTIKPAGVNFGPVPIGERVSRTVEIRNDTGVPVTVRVPPSPPGVFEWAAVDEELPNGEAKVVEFVFRSVDNSFHTEQVRVTSTAAGSPQDIGLVGKGPGGFPFPPEEPLPTRLFFSSSTLDFGSTAVGTTESQHLDIRNETGRSVRITIDPPHPESVFQWQAVDTSLATGTKRRVTVRFTAKSAAVMRGMLVVTSATASSPESIRLIGRGPGDQNEPGDPDRPDVHPR